MWSKLEFGGEGRVGSVDVEDVSKKDTSFKLMSPLKRENREREEENPGMEPLETSIRNPGTCEGGQAASREVVEPPFPYTDGS